MEQSDKHPQSSWALVSQAKRNGLIDALRFCAAIGIVVFHVDAPGAGIGYAALPLFTIYLAHFASTDRQRAFYFLRLWIVWSVVYAALKIAEILFLDTSWQQEFSPTMLLTGPSIHLWFLPFAAAVVYFADPVRKALSVPIVIVTSLAALYAVSQLSPPIPLVQWLFVLPSFAFGLILSGSWALPAAILVVSLGYMLGWTSGLLQFAIAAGLATITMFLHIPANKLTGWMRDTSLGIYLIHPIPIAVCARLGVEDPTLLATLGVILSIISVFALQPRLRVLF